MPIQLKRAYLAEIRERYRKSTKKEKGRILNEFCAVCRYSRKYAIRILTEKITPRVKKPGPGPRYNGVFVHHLKYLWEMMNKMCSKKMKAALPQWLSFYKSIDDKNRALMLTVSSATIDRLLRPYKSKNLKGLSSTRPSLIKNKIPIRLLSGEVQTPGVIEADTVSHCGSSLSGSFINSLTATDLFSGWTENRACLTKEAELIKTQVSRIENALPFSIISFASDSGSEFINECLYYYFNKRKAPIHFVRRRPYKKNDNAHVEQKNWTHIRELFGYQRFDHPELVIMMNEIYQAFWNPLWNYFTPVMKLKSKTRVGGRIIKKYDDPKTPYHRLMECSYISAKEKAILRQNYEMKNPFFLKQELDRKLKKFFERADELNKLKQTGS